MTYNLDESHNSINYTPAGQVMSVFGYPRIVKWITIHHWGVNGQQFDVIRDFLCTNTKPTSAHYVVEAGQAACIVNETDVAWHAGNALGNAQSIGIECRPEATSADYQTIAEVIRDIRSRFGDVPLVPHNYWTATDCPGSYDLERLDRLARTGTSGQSTTVTPIQEQNMDLTPANLQDISRAVWGYRNSAAKDPFDMHQALINAAKPVPAAPVTLTDAQVTALADQLRAALPAATLEAFKAQINK